MQRVLMFVGGAWILHHEVAVADESELMLVIAGLWLTGVPIAQLLDILRGIVQSLPEQRPPPEDRSR